MIRERDFYPPVAQPGGAAHISRRFRPFRAGIPDLGAWLVRILGAEILHIREHQTLTAAVHIHPHLGLLAFVINLDQSPVRLPAGIAHQQVQVAVGAEDLHRSVVGAGGPHVQQGGAAFINADHAVAAQPHHISIVRAEINIAIGFVHQFQMIEAGAVSQAADHLPSVLGKLYSGIVIFIDIIGIRLDLQCYRPGRTQMQLLGGIGRADPHIPGFRQVEAGGIGKVVRRAAEGEAQSPAGGSGLPHQRPFVHQAAAGDLSQGNRRTGRAARAAVEAQHGVIGFHKLSFPIQRAGGQTETVGQDVMPRQG